MGKLRDWALVSLACALLHPSSWSPPYSAERWKRTQGTAGGGYDGPGLEATAFLPACTPFVAIWRPLTEREAGTCIIAVLPRLSQSPQAGLDDVCTGCGRKPIEMSQVSLVDGAQEVTLTWT